MVRTDRRGFLGRLGAIAAAVVAVEAAPKVAEASAGASDLWFSDAAIEHGDGPTGWYHGGDGVKQYLIDGVEAEQAHFAAVMAEMDRGYATWAEFQIANSGVQTNPLLTFTPQDVVLKDGAHLDGAVISVNGRLLIDGKDISVSNCTITTGKGIELTSNCQRILLTNNVIMHDVAPLTPHGEQIRAEGYADGYLQATQRARSRIAEGLTV